MRDASSARHSTTVLPGDFLSLAKPRIYPAAAFDINRRSSKIFMAVIRGVETPSKPIARTLAYFFPYQQLAGSLNLTINLSVAAVTVVLKPAV